MARELSTSSLANDANLVSYYKLENTSDSKGTNTLTNNGSVAFNPAQFNNGADGGASNTTKYLSYSSGNLGIDGGAISLSAWINVTTIPANTTGNHIIHQFSSISHVTNHIDYQQLGGVVQLNFGRFKSGVGEDAVTYNITFTTGTWHHVAYTYDGVNIRGYVDGVLVAGPTAASGSGSSGLTSGVALFSSSNTAATNMFSGLIDDVAIFSRALSSSEVANIFSGVFSPSSSVSPSISPSASLSPSASISPSISPSSSVSPSISPSASISPSISPSASKSPSASISSSASISPSSSLSPSPSLGYAIFSRGDAVVLPTDTTDLTTIYSENDEIHVAQEDGVRVGQDGQTPQYMIHEFKNFIGDNTVCEIEWEGRSTLAPRLSPVYMQIFNQVTHTWETVALNNSHAEDIDFELEEKINDTSNYKDTSGIVTCRVYQLAI